VRSPGDFDGLDAPGSWFLSQRPTLQVRGTLANKKKSSSKKGFFKLTKITTEK